MTRKPPYYFDIFALLLENENQRMILCEDPNKTMYKLSTP